MNVLKVRASSDPLPTISEDNYKEKRSYKTCKKNAGLI